MTGLIEPKTSRVCWLKISLMSSEPLVWRRVLVRDGVLLSRLHRIFQTVMGWQDSHWHQFKIRNQRYGLRDLDEWDEQLLEERQYRLAGLALQENDRFLYKYGNNWLHEVNLERWGDLVYVHPVCLAGMNACPPENCGSIAGYADWLKMPANPSCQAVEWDAGRFDLSAVNAGLMRMKR